MLILKVNMFGACYFNTRRVQVSWCPGVLASWSHPLVKSTRQATGAGKAEGRAAAGAKCQWPTSQPTTHNINIKWKARRERSRLSGNKLEGPRTLALLFPCFPLSAFIFICIIFLLRPSKAKRHMSPGWKGAAAACCSYPGLSPVYVTWLCAKSATGSRTSPPDTV